MKFLFALLFSFGMLLPATHAASINIDVGNLFQNPFQFIGSRNGGINGVGNHSSPKGVTNAISNGTNLPKGDLSSDIIPRIIQTILGLFSVFLTGVAIWSGTLFVLHYGDEEKLNQAKHLLLSALVGVAVSATTYALVSGIGSLNFNR